MAESGESDEIEASEETEDATLKEEEKGKEARPRRRGPYRKAHADW